MSRDAVLPFALGTTYFEGRTPVTTEASGLEGRTYVVQATEVDSSTGVQPELTGRYKKVMVVRNSSAAVALPKKIAKMKTDGSGKEYLGEIMAYADTVGELGYPVDEFLPAAGAPINDLFYVVVEGIAKVISTGAATIGIGEFVIPSTAGAVTEQNIAVAAGADTFNQIQGAIGRAVTAAAAVANTEFYICVGGK